MSGALADTRDANNGGQLGIRDANSAATNAVAVSKTAYMLSLTDEALRTPVYLTRRPTHGFGVAYQVRES